MPFSFATFFDAELVRHNSRLKSAAAVSPGERVLDIGCGAGRTTLEAAQAAWPGPVLGVDTSSELLQVAWERAHRAGLANVSFEQGDAQPHPLPPQAFDLCISRFGVMFFSDPAAASAHLVRALAPDGRIAWIVWQGHPHNEWSTELDEALGLEGASSSLAAFSLADPETATRQLERAGFQSIGLEDVQEPVFYGSSVDEAFEAVTRFQFVRQALSRSAEPEDLLERLRAMLTEHLSAEGVLFDSRAWIITGRKAP